MIKFVKKIICLSCVTSVSLFALDNAAVNQIKDGSIHMHKKAQKTKTTKKPQSKQAKKPAKLSGSGSMSLKKGYDFFEAKNYKKSYQIAIDYTKTHPEDIDAWLLAGDSAFKLGDFDSAIAAFDCVLILDENNIHAHLESAKIYAIGGNKELLKLEINALMQLDMFDAQDKKDFKELLDMLNSNKGRFYADINVNLFFDSNPFSESEKRKERLDTKASAGSGIGFNAGYDYQFNDNYSASASFGFYDKHYFEKEDEAHGKYPHFRMFSLYFSPKKHIDELSSIFINATYSYMLYKDEKFLHSPSLGIGYSQSFSNGFSFDVGLDYTKNMFLGKYSDEKSLDASNNYDHLSAFTSLKYMFDNNMLYTRFYMATDKIAGTKINKDDISTEYDSYGMMINYNKFFRKFYTSVGYSLDYSRYKEGNYGYDEARRDFTHRLFGNITYTITQALNASLNLSYTKRYSNIDGSANVFAGLSADYTYDQLFWQFGFRYSF